MKKLLFTVAVVTSIIFLASCKDDSVTDAKLSYVFKTTNLNASLGATADLSGQVVAVNTNGSINWTAASINISKISFSAMKGTTSIALESKNIFNVNPLRPDSLAGTITVPAGNYEDINFKLSLAEANVMPVILNGVYIESSGTKIPVVVQLSYAQLIELTYPKITVEQSATYKASITLELNNLVKGLTASDFGQTTRSTPNNAIVVTPTLNRPLYEKLTTRLKACLSVTLSKS